MAAWPEILSDGAVIHRRASKERCNDGELEINSPKSGSAIETEGFGS